MPETRLTLKEVCQRLGKTANTIRTWSVIGAPVNGVRVQLECTHAGQGVIFTEEGLRRFTENCRLAKLGVAFDAPETPDEERERLEARCREVLANW